MLTCPGGQTRYKKEKKWKVIKIQWAKKHFPPRLHSKIKAFKMWFLANLSIVDLYLIHTLILELKWLGKERRKSLRYPSVSLVAAADAAGEKSSTLCQLPHCGPVPNTGIMQTSSHSCVRAPKQPPFDLQRLELLPFLLMMSPWHYGEARIVMCVCDPSIAPEHFSGPNQYEQLVFFLCVSSGISSVQLVTQRQAVVHSKRNTPLMLNSVAIRCQFWPFNCDSVFHCCCFLLSLCCQSYQGREMFHFRI